jgi:hypothetical protein
MTFTITNTGDLGSTLAGTVQSGGQFTCTQNCAYSLTKGQSSLPVTISFNTDVVPNTYQLTLIPSVTFYTVPTAMLAIGKVIPPVTIPATVNFGNVAKGRTKTVTFDIKNISTTDFPATDVTGVTGVFTCDAGCSNIVLTKNTTRTVTLSYKPTTVGAADIVNANVTIGGVDYKIVLRGVTVDPQFKVIEI